jgi:hypothetical protein
MLGWCFSTNPEEILRLSESAGAERLKLLSLNGEGRLIGNGKDWLPNDPPTFLPTCP